MGAEITRVRQTGNVQALPDDNLTGRACHRPALRRSRARMPCDHPVDWGRVFRVAQAKRIVATSISPGAPELAAVLAALPAVGYDFEP
jgi:hypothetical protein